MVGVLAAAGGEVEARAAEGGLQLVGGEEEDVGRGDGEGGGGVEVDAAQRGEAEGEEVVVELAEGADEFVIRVVDNGVGVPPDFSVERATGLGLSWYCYLARPGLGARIAAAAGRVRGLGTSKALVPPAWRP